MTTTSDAVPPRHPARESRYRDAAELAGAVADAIAARLRDALALRAAASLVVPGGRTPGPIFDRLALSALDWPRVRIALSDERWVAPGHADSNETLVRERLLHGAAAAAAFTGLYRPTAAPEDAVRAVSAALAVVPRPFDVVLLGMGEDGHVASLFPGQAAGSALQARVGPACVAVAPAPGRGARLSLTLSALTDARAILLVFQGGAKQAVYAAARARPATPALPVSWLLHQDRAPIEVHFSP
ncbi:MAG: 6-phosphogluconolactonase [Gammaproteobacteria bacterium]